MAEYLQVKNSMPNDIINYVYLCLDGLTLTILTLLFTSHSDLHWFRCCLITLKVWREISHLNTVHPILVVD